MTLEQILTTWFAGHPFLRAELLLAVGTVSAYLKHDYEKYKVDVAADPTLYWQWRIAARQAGKAMALAVLPPLLGKVFFILGSA